MARTISLLIALALNCFGGCSCLRVEDILFASYTDHTLMYIVSDKTVQYRTTRLGNPSRIYLDILNTKIGKNLTAGIEFSDLLIQYIKVAPCGNKTRLVLGLNTAVSEKVIRLKNPPGLLVNFQKRTSAASP